MDQTIEFFTELISTPDGWDKAPCSYIQLSASYSSYAEQAEQRGWKVIKRNAHHFEMLTNPAEIGQLILEMSQNKNI